MNSLTELNGRGLSNIEYGDTRDPSVTFNKGAPDNTSIYIRQNQSFSSPQGIDIVEIINYPVCNVSYIIDLSNTDDGVTVTWTNLPSNCVVTKPSAKVWKVSGIRSDTDWNLVKNPTIQLIEEEATNFTYTATITYLTSSVMTWNIAVNITPFDVWSDTYDFDYPNNIATTVTGFPIIYDTTVNNIVWTVSITPDNLLGIESMSTNGTLGGSSSYNALTKVITIIGTKPQVNSHLHNFTFKSILDSNANFTMTYRATNNTDTRDKTTIQYFIAEYTKYLGLVGGPINYSEDIDRLIVNYPVITDLNNVNGTFIYTIQPNPINAIREFTNSGSGGAVEFNNITKTITFTGNKSQINNRLASTTIAFAPDYTSNFELNYTVLTPASKTNTKTQNVNCTETHNELTNYWIERRYTGALDGDLIFQYNTPQISDLDTHAINYTITMTCPTGRFGTNSNNATSNYTFTGTRAEVNAQLHLIRFFNNPNQWYDTNISYTQSKDGMLQMTIDIPFNGPYVALNTTPIEADVSLLEGQSHLIPVQSEIEYINPSMPGTITYMIDVTRCVGAKVEWDTVPVGCTVTNAITGIYKMEGITTISQWNLIKQPRITLPNNYFGEFFYIPYIIYPLYPSSGSVNWSVNTTVANVPLFSSYTNTFVYSTLSDYNLYNLGYLPILVDQGNQTPVFTYTITPGDASVISGYVSNVVSGSMSVNQTTKVCTITGTKDQVNIRLQNLIISMSNVEINVPMYYEVTNNANLETDYGYVDLWNLERLYLDNPSATSIYWQEETEFLVTDGPLITDYLYGAGGGGSYTMTITPSTTNAVRTITATGNNGSVSFNNTSKVLTITGTRSQVNSYIPNIIITPKGDYVTDFNLSYTVNTPRNDTNTKSILMHNTLNSAEVSNMIGFARNYDNDLNINLFSTNTPVIVDTDPFATSYTITLTSSLGTFNGQSTYTFSGTKAQVNANFQSIYFRSVFNGYSTGTFTYTQSKDGTLQLTTTEILNGPWTPTYPKTFVNDTATVSEGVSNLVYMPINLLGTSYTGNSTLSIDLRNCKGAKVSNDALAGDVVKTETGDMTDGYQYSFANINTKEEWDSVVTNLKVTLPNAYNGSFPYTVTFNRSIQSGFTSSYTWSRTLTVTDVTPFSYFTSKIVKVNSPINLGGNGYVPNLTDDGNQNPIWTVTLTPDIAHASDLGWSSTGSGGTFSIDANKVLTISGSVAVVNSYLSGLSISIANTNDHFITIVGTNNTTTETQTVMLSIYDQNNYILGPVPTGTYAEDIAFVLPTCEIRDVLSDGSGTYKFEITFSNADQVTSVTFGGTGGTATYDSPNRKITLIGTKAQVIDQASHITAQPYPDLNADIVTYQLLTTPNNQVASKLPSVSCATPSPEVSNMVDRYYINNQPNAIFAINTPQIIDLNPNSNQVYTVILTAEYGRFGFNDATAINGFTYVGTKAQVNSIMSTIYYFPESWMSTQTINMVYQQYRGDTSIAGAVNQVNVVNKIYGPYFAVNPKSANTTQTTTEGSSFFFVVPTNITGVTDPTNSAATLRIDVTGVGNTTVIWTTIPAGCTVTNPSTGIYQITGIKSVATWNQVSSPIINLPNDFFGTVTLTSTLTVPDMSGTLTYTSTNTVTVSDVLPFTSITSPMNYARNTTYQLSTYAAVPTLQDPGTLNPTWTVTITPTKPYLVETWTVNGTGGTVQIGTSNWGYLYNAMETVKVLTITGTVAQVNSRLSNTYFTSYANGDVDGAFTYTATNNLTAESDTKVLTLNSTAVDIMTKPTSDSVSHLNYSEMILNNPIIGSTTSTTFNIKIGSNDTSRYITAPLMSYVPGTVATIFTDTKAYAYSVQYWNGYLVSGDGLTVVSPPFDRSTTHATKYKLEGNSLVSKGDVVTVYNGHTIGPFQVTNTGLLTYTYASVPNYDNTYSEKLYIYGSYVYEATFNTTATQQYTIGSIYIDELQPKTVFAANSTWNGTNQVISFSKIDDITTTTTFTPLHVGNANLVIPATWYRGPYASSFQKNVLAVQFANAAYSPRNVIITFNSTNVSQLIIGLEADEYDLKQVRISENGLVLISRAVLSGTPLKERTHIYYRTSIDDLVWVKSTTTILYNNATTNNASIVSDDGAYIMHNNRIWKRSGNTWIYSIDAIEPVMTASSGTFKSISYDSTRKRIIIYHYKVANNNSSSTITIQHVQDSAYVDGNTPYIVYLGLNRTNANALLNNIQLSQNTIPSGTFNPYSIEIYYKIYAVNSQIESTRNQTINIT